MIDKFNQNRFWRTFIRPDPLKETLKNLMSVSLCYGFSGSILNWGKFIRVFLKYIFFILRIPRGLYSMNVWVKERDHV